MSPRCFLALTDPADTATWRGVVLAAGLEPSGAARGCVAVLVDEHTPPKTRASLSEVAAIVDVSWLRADARVLGAAVAQARETWRREAWTREVGRFTLDLERAEHPDEVGRLASEGLAALTAFDTVAVFRRRGSRLVPQAHSRLQGRVPVPALDAAQHPALRDMFVAPRVVVIEDYPAFEDGLPETVRLGLRSLVLVPSVVEGEVQGVLAAATLHLPHAPDEAETRLLEFAAARLGHALRRASDRAQLSRRLTALEAASTVAERLRPLTDLAGVHKAISDLALDAAQASTVSVLLHDPGSDTLRVTYSAGDEAHSMQGTVLPRGEGLSWRVFESGRPFFTQDARHEEGVVWRGTPVPGWNSLIVPLTDTESRPIGVLAVGADGGQHRLSAGDVALVQALAHAAGAKLARLELRLRAEREREAYRALAEFGARIEARHEIDALLHLGETFAARHFGLDFAGCYDVIPGALRLRRMFDAVTGVVVAGEEIVHSARGLVGAVAESGEWRYTDDYANSPWAHEGTRHTRITTLLGVPISRGGRVAHVFVAGARGRAVTLDAVQRTVFQNFVKRLENALEREGHLRDVERARESSLRALGLALEFRDFETGGHTDRVVALARRFGASLGLGPEDLTALTWGAYLHDVGKVALPDSILLKPGGLGPDEFAVVRNHVVIGDLLCAEMTFLPEGTRAVVRAHHERWDGAGYPDGLAGEAIPLLARVFSLIDVYDALVHARPYKAAWSRERALATIEADAGRAFDPELAAAFVALLRDEPARADPDPARRG